VEQFKKVLISHFSQATNVFSYALLVDLIIQPIPNSYTNFAIPALPVPTTKTINSYAQYTKSVFPEVTSTLDKNMKFYDLVFTDLFIKN
jgi:hypothetical protein